MATPNYDINYDDKRFTEVEADKKAALTEVEKTYGGMINESDKYYQAQINAANQWGETQKQNQQAMTDFTIEQINQQKDQAHKDYIKEQSGAYADWQKQSNQYGANAEQVAAQGLTNAGYSESSQVSMYNTYQNRVATAREVYTRAVLDYDNDIKEARLKNSSALAEIAFQTLQTKLELGLQGFQYKNQLIIEKSNQKLKTDEMYYTRYQDVLEQINEENKLKEQMRQFGLEYDLKKDEYDLQQENLQIQKDRLAEEKRQFDVTQAAKTAGVSGAISGSSKKKPGSSATSAAVNGINKANSAQKATSYNNACAIMKSKGVDSGVIGGLMTSEEWRRRRSSYNASGVGNEAVKNYSSYNEYINDYIAYAVSNK